MTNPDKENRHLTEIIGRPVSDVREVTTVDQQGVDRLRKEGWIQVFADGKPLMERGKYLFVRF